MGELRWTDEQARALVDPENGLLSASAGTGKTRTIIGKIAWMLGLDVEPRADGRPIPPCPSPCRLEQVAAITFTEKAACELKERLRERIESSARSEELRWNLDRASVGTIHAFCARLLRDHALRLAIDPTFRVIDERESTLRLHEIIRDRIMEAVRGGGEEIARLLGHFQLYESPYSTGLIGAVAAVVRDVRWHAEPYRRWTTGDGAADGAANGASLDRSRLVELAEALLGAEAAASSAASDGLALADALYGLARAAESAWVAWMKEENVRDYDSLILDARRLLTAPEHRPALEAIRAELRILIIDEFQDTDHAQQDIAFALAGIGEPASDDTPQLLLVGDPKQSIYGFRGADISVWNHVRRVLCGERPPHRLTVNFRTQPGVVGFINEVSSSAIEATGAALEPLDPALRVGYSPLVPHRDAAPCQGIDWLDCSIDGGRAAECRDLETRLVVSRIRALLENGRVCDGETPEGRPVRPRDIAILSRNRHALKDVEAALREAGIAVFNAASMGLSRRQEVIDLITVLRLLADPEDDYHAFAFLRSPFVGLRDEVIARFRLDPGARGASLLRQAAGFLRRAESGDVDWFEAPEGADIARTEREALARALAVLEVGRSLVDRADASELLEEVVRRTGYRLHLLLRPSAEMVFAAMEGFAALLDEYRHLSIGSFLDLWDRWGEQDLGVPQAPLHSAADDVVTLQTIHTAKGLEWPIVVLIRAGDPERDRLTDQYLSDPRLGPTLMAKKADRGPRAAAIAARALAAEQAEEARLLYVALTRTRDRLIIGAPAVDRGYMTYMRAALSRATAPHLVADEGRALPGRRPAARACADDPVTRTGGQIEVFADADADQLDIFIHAPPAAPDEPVPAASAGEAPRLPLRPVVYRDPEPLQGSLDPMRVSLSWLDGLAPGELAPLARPVSVPRGRAMTSATEMLLRASNPDAWRLRYLHGVAETWRFAPDGQTGTDVPAELRGTLIHGVLERIRAVEELSDLLNESIAAVDAPPGIEELLRPGASYRAALEAEIERVVQGKQWQWYVEGRHYRELRFIVLTAGRPWRTGAIDLYRPGDEPWIVDFKTHRIEATEAAAVAAEYAVQADVYRDAATALNGRTPRVLLHFTYADTAVEV